MNSFWIAIDESAFQGPFNQENVKEFVLTLDKPWKDIYSAHTNIDIVMKGMAGFINEKNPVFARVRFQNDSDIATVFCCAIHGNSVGKISLIVEESFTLKRPA